jgi:hypothetical protein
MTFKDFINFGKFLLIGVLGICILNALVYLVIVLDNL